MLYTVKTFLDDGRDIKLHICHGRSRSANSADLWRKVTAKIKTNKEWTNSQLAKDHRVSRGTTRNYLRGQGWQVTNNAIGQSFMLKTFVKSNPWLLVRSFQRVKIWLNWLKNFNIQLSTYFREHWAFKLIYIPKGIWRT